MILTGSENSRIAIRSYFDDRRSTGILPPFELDEQFRDFIESQNTHMQVRNYFMAERQEESAASKPFYGTPDASFELDKFTRFPVMEEVLREYVYGVYVRKRGDKFVLRVYDESGDNKVLDDPLILLDGVPIFDADIIMDIDPLGIEKIDVVRRKYGYGSEIANGIIAFYSYKSDLAGYTLPPSALRSNYFGLQDAKQFYIPVKGEGRNVPDLRNQVYWEPRMLLEGTTSGSLNVTLPENAGTFLIVIQGMASGDAFGSSSATFSIKNK